MGYVMAKKRNGSNGSTGPILDDDGYEIIGGNSQEMAIGEVVEGKYGGVIRTMAGQKKGSRVNFHQVGNRSILGGAVIEARIKEGNIQIGDMLKIVRLEDGKKKPGQNAPKIFTLAVKRAR